MILTALTATLESAFNAWLKLDGNALPRLHRLQGKIIALHITGLDLKLFFIPTSAGVTISMAYDTPADVTIRGSAMALARLANSDDSGKSILENRIQMEGDLGVGQQFSAILREIDIDWEELLSHAVGDIVAHQMGQITRQTQGWFKDTAYAMRLNTQEYLQEESRVLTAQAEIAHYSDQIDNLRLDTERLEARIQRLKNQAS